MSVKINIKPYLDKKGLTQDELAEKLNITSANLSNLLNGKSYEKLWDTLEKICTILNCEFSDIIIHNRDAKVIHVFLDYSGTLDLLLEGGVDNVKRFLDAIYGLEKKLSMNNPEGNDYRIQVAIVSGSSKTKVKTKVLPFYQMAKRYGMPYLFTELMAEYSGFRIKIKDGIPVDTDIKVEDIANEDKYFIEQQLFENLPELEANREKINEMLKPYGGYISPQVTSSFNIQFPKNLEEDKFNEAVRKLKEMLEENLGRKLDGFIDIIPYYDKYGIECDVIDVNNNKATAVRRYVESLKEKPEIIVMGGDDRYTDIKMLTGNEEEFARKGIKCAFLAPAGNGELSEEIASKPNVIPSKWENVSGVIDTLEKLMVRIKVKSDGKGGHIWEL